MSISCKKCDDVFFGRARRLYCSRACHHQDRPPAWNKGKTGLRPNRKRNGVYRNCKQCGKEFYIRPSRAGFKMAHFCCQTCYLNHRWKTDGCQYCGKKCSERYCSEKCKKESANKSKSKSNWNRKLSLINTLGGKCVECGFDDYRALDIDHINPSKKIKPKDGKYTWARRFKDWENNKGNIRLLCSNCHRLHTWSQRSFGLVINK